jgi:hypothetical protein
MPCPHGRESGASDGKGYLGKHERPVDQKK